MQPTRSLIRKPRHVSDRWRHRAKSIGRSFAMPVVPPAIFERDWIKRQESGTHVRLTGVSTESGLCYASSAKPSALPLGCFRWSRPALN